MEHDYLIGEHLGHSWSAGIHRAFGRYDYELLELSPAELGPFLKRRAFAGLNVTIPYKEAVIPYLDRLDPAAAAIGAVNTVVNRDGVLWGYNTDFSGLRSSILRLETDLKGKTALIFGTGGSSKTALAVCKALGAKELFRVSRTGRDGALSYAEAYARFGRPLPRDSVSDAPHPSAPAALPPSPEGEGFGPAVQRGLVIINCTPVGMWPDLDGLPTDLNAFDPCHSEGSEESASAGPDHPSPVPCHLSPAPFPRLSAVFDCVYNPLRTRLVLAARERGIPALGGLEMLVRQAALACELFTGAPVPEKQVAIICDTLRRERENLVLIGMPGAGKSTIARLLAQKTGREFIDLDEEVVRRAEKCIPAIFSEDGEAAFRALEAAVLRTAALKTGCVIATGGGTVLRAENLRRLKQTGRLIFLDRPLSALVPSPERPLGDTAEKIARLYAERLPLYTAAAELRIDNSATPEEAAEAVLAALQL